MADPAASVFPADRRIPAPSPRPARVHVVLNHRSGTHGATDANVAARVREVLGARGVDVRVDVAHTGAELRQACAQAARGDVDVVVAGGGDGTIAAVAGCLIDTPKILGVLPLGTFNYFARIHGVPLALDEALDVVASGTVRPAPVGEVNGRIFLNNSSIGLYPTVLRQRETTYLRLGRSRVVAYLSVALTLTQPPALLNLRLTADGTPLSRRTPLLFVGTNRHQLETFAIPGGDCIDRDRLALCITRPMGVLEIWRLALRALVRGLHGTPQLEVVCARELRVAMRRRHVRVALDGEVELLETPLQFRLRADALQVLVPAADPPRDG